LRKKTNLFKPCTKIPFPRRRQRGFCDISVWTQDYIYYNTIISYIVFTARYIIIIPIHHDRRGTKVARITTLVRYGISIMSAVRNFDACRLILMYIVRLTALGFS